MATTSYSSFPSTFQQSGCGCAGSAGGNDPMDWSPPSNQNSSSQDDICGVCLEPVVASGLRYALFEHCDHRFCEPCGRSLMHYRRPRESITIKCPTCRTLSGRIIISKGFLTGQRKAELFDRVLCAASPDHRLPPIAPAAVAAAAENVPSTSNHNTPALNYNPEYVHFDHLPISNFHTLFYDFGEQDICRVCLEPVESNGRRYALFEACDHRYCEPCGRALMRYRRRAINYFICPTCREPSGRILFYTHYLSAGPEKTALFAPRNEAAANGDGAEGGEGGGPVQPEPFLFSDYGETLEADFFNHRIMLAEMDSD